MTDNYVYRVYTYHRTQMFLDWNGRLIHRRLDDVSANVLPVYAQMIDDGAAFFVIKDNKIVYLSGLTENRKDSETPIKINLANNEDGTVSIIQGDKNLSARRDNGSFALSDNNSDWEHFTFDRAEFKLTSEYIPPFVRSFEPQSKKHAELTTVPKVSVIIPMFNASDFIEECLESILKQTFTDYEVIVVDDCSTDHSVEVVENMRERFNGKLKLIRLNKNSGNPGTPRNVGLNGAVGKYVYFLDSDDLLIDKAFAILYDAAEKYNADLLDNGRYYFFWRREGRIDSKLVMNQNIKKVTFEQRDMKEHVRDFYNRRYWITPWCKFLRREFLIENQIVFPSTYAIEDATFSFQCIVCAKIFVRIPDVFYMYNIRTGSITKTRRSLNEHLTRYVATIETVFKVIDNFMNRTHFFAEHPESRYVAVKHFFEYHLNGGVAGLKDQYWANQASLIHNITYRVISEGVSFSDELIAIILVNANTRLEQLIERDRRIEKLQAELNRLNAIKNPAD